MGTKVVGGNYLDQSRFSTKYAISFSTLDSFGHYIMSGDFIDNVKKFFSEPSSFLNSIKLYPFDVTQFYLTNADSNIIIGNKTTDYIGKLLSSPYKSIRISTITINKQAGYTNPHEFLNYEPYTTIQMYLPYLAFIDLPVNEVIDKTLDVYYSVDFSTGMCTATITARNIYGSSIGDGDVIVQYTGKIGIDIPFGTTNSTDLLRNNISNILKMGVGVAGVVGGGSMGGTLGGIIGLKAGSIVANSGIDAITNNQLRYSRGGSGGGFNTIASPNTLYVIIKRMKPVDVDGIDGYASVKGRPLGEMRTLSGLTGFTIVSDIHLNGFTTATSDELTELEQLLHTGVILGYIPE